MWLKWKEVVPWVLLWIALFCQPTASECDVATSITTVPFSRNLNNNGPTSTFSDLTCSIFASSQSEWLSFTPAANVLARAKVSSQSFSASLAIFSGSCDSLTCLGATSYTSYTELELYWAASAGTTYYMVVTDQYTGNGSFNFRLEAPGDDQDTCSEAVDISSSLPFIKDENNKNAYPSFSDLACNVNDESLGRWYQLNVATDTMARATVSNQDISLGVAVFQGSCGSLACIGTTETSYYNNVVFTWAAAASTAYLILVFGSDFNQAGNFRIRIETFARPANDRCNTALDVTATLPYISVDSNTAAYPGFTDVVCGIDSSSRGLWYQISPAADTIARITVKNQEFDVGVALYNSCQDTTCQAEQSYTSSFSELVSTWAASGGSTYYLFVYGVEDGTYQVEIETLRAPNNDQCGSALDVSASIPYVSVDSNIAAFPRFTDVVCGVDRYSRGVWYAFTPTKNTIASISVTNQQFDVGVALYESCQAKICDGEQSSTSSFSEVGWTFTAFAGSTFYMFVYGTTFDEEGTYRITIKQLSTPSNDECSAAIDVTNSLPYTSVDSNTGAFPSFADIVCGVISDARGVWYKITPVSNDDIRITVSNQDFAVGVAVYGGSCQATPCLGEESFTSPYGEVVQTWSASAGTTYYMLVYGEGFGAAGNFQVRIESIGPASTTPAPIPAPTAPQPTISAPVTNPSAPVPNPSAPIPYPSAPVPTGLAPFSSPISITPPTPDSGGGGPFDFLNNLCFSGYNYVFIRDKGYSRMQDIQIGDFVQVAQTKVHEKLSIFSPVISFSHIDKTREAEFLQIYVVILEQQQNTTTNNIPPLEISHDHMVIKKDTKMILRAKDIQVGDILDGDLVVTRIGTIKRRGLYAPVTAAGTIIVSGVTSSSYVAILDSSIIPSIVQHYGAHALYAPIRLLCGYHYNDIMGFSRYNEYICSENEYTNGISTYILPIVNVVMKIRTHYPASVQVLAAIIMTPCIACILASEQVLLLFHSLILFLFIVSTIVLVLLRRSVKNEYSKPQK